MDYKYSRSGHYNSASALQTNSFHSWKCYFGKLRLRAPQFSKRKIDRLLLIKDKRKKTDTEDRDESSRKAIYRVSVC